MPLELLNDVSFDLSEEGIVTTGVSGKLKLFSEVEAEHTHDRLAVYGVSAGLELDIEIVLAGNSDEIVKVSDGYKADLDYSNGFHNLYLRGNLFYTIIVPLTEEKVNGKAIKLKKK